MRAVWVTRADYKTADDVTRILDDCKGAGFNTIIFQIRGNGTAFYKSSFEPWADELGGSDPGWDPLAHACREAHARDLELHAWVNVMPAWRGPNPPTNPEQLYLKRPEWFWYDAAGNREPLVHTVGDQTRPWYVSVNPCLPEVRQYLVDVFREIVANYDIDGLHMDYIRFPNEPVVSGERIPDYPRDAATLALYKEETGLEPDQDAERWNQWRTDCVTKLVADIHRMMRRTKPSAALTASVGTRRDSSLAHFRDERRWAREHLIDAAFPMNYVDDPNEFGQRLDNWLAEKPPVPVVPGLWFGRHRGKSVEEATAAVQQQIEIARAKTGNFCIFSYTGLFQPGRGRDRRVMPGATTTAPGGAPTTRDADEDNLAAVTGDEQQRTARPTRRTILVPFLQGLAAADAEQHRR